MSKLQMVDLGRNYRAHKTEIDAAMSAVLEKAAYINGPSVVAFEKALGEWMGGTNVVSCASGTEALQVAFMALGIGTGDEVITTPFTFVATVEALVLLGAKPVFVDIDPKTYNLDIGAVEKRITDRTRAIVPVHLYGQCVEMDPLLALGRKHNLPIIEDTAQAIGARHKGRQAGVMGEIGCLSFFPAKNLGCFGDGGALTVRSPELAARCRMIANHGSRIRYQHELVGINSRLDTLQAAVLLAKLPHLQSFNEGRRRVALAYDVAFKGLPIQTPYVSPDCEHVYQQYTIRTDSRDQLAAFLKDKDIPSAIHYPRPLHLQEAFTGFVASGETFPEAERASREVLSLPMFPEMTDGEIAMVVEAVKGFFE
ncbi:MAG: DegT/DnrJ/EryC1/StrS family aminotransferase [Deltaproteobacteria bacterium]|nr:DegT/DnrJ/EryC1/StrS family aminotransferase [Deltaproteobacteria bacterium]